MAAKLVLGFPYKDVRGMTWFQQGRVPHVGPGDSGDSWDQAGLRRLLLWDACSRLPVFAASVAAAPTPVGGP